ncbi:MAG TPA: VOC family protein [Thermoanaerobaculia bacterium]|jgi:PhnB protein|nr:VOC family protein [Thermoanaerobaculia bacterium]
MIEVNAYIFFKGNCAEAMRFYEKTLGGKLRLLTGKDMPESNVPPQMADAIMHGRLDLDNGGFFMASDWMSPDPYPGMSGFRVSLSYPTVAEANRIFDALADGGSVQLPFQKTFWSPGFGMLTDRFGTPWMVGSEEGQHQ